MNRSSQRSRSPFDKLRAERERRIRRSRMIIIGIQLHRICAAGKTISSFAVFACFCSKSSLLLVGLKSGCLCTTESYNSCEYALLLLRPLNSSNSCTMQNALPPAWSTRLETPSHREFQQAKRMLRVFKMRSTASEIPATVPGSNTTRKRRKFPSHPCPEPCLR